MTKHTAEPWKVSTDDNYRIEITAADRSVVIDMDWSEIPDEWPTKNRLIEDQRATFYRIVADHNALRGLNPEGVRGLIEAAVDVIGETDIQHENDKWVCRWCAREYDQNPFERCESDDCPGYRLAAALAAVKGE